jgi:crotonobetainyl-CoA:carnitine CoA-transferase CaiB-like acyl-CoA transferase
MPAASDVVQGPGALGPRRVLELADESGVYCGKLLADMGADVIKIERPGGDATRRIPPFSPSPDPPDRSREDASLFFLCMNTSKRGVTLDIERSEGRALFRRLARTADLIVETFPPGHLEELGLGYASLRRENPGLVLTSITGFGQTGPHRRFKSSDLVASALGGSMQVVGHAEDPPVVLAGSQAHIAASTCAAVSSLIALHHSVATGHGQHVDISLEEVTLAVSHICGVGKWLDDGIIPRRLGSGLFHSVPSGTYRCTDGLVYLTVNRPLHWKALAEWIHEETGNQEVIDPMFEGSSSVRQPYRELLDLFISDLTAKHTVDEVYREGQRRHIAFSPVNGASRVVRDAHLDARGYFLELEHPRAGRLRYPGAPYRHSETPWQLRCPAPLVGQHNREIFAAELGPPAEDLRPACATRGSYEAGPPPGRSSMKQALQGVRVVEFAVGMAGPWIGRFMAYCGAEVIRIESKKRPGVVRLYVPPWAPEMGVQPEMSPWFTDWDAGKRFVALDLTRPEAVALAKRLVAASDIVVENYATGVMQKLGLGYPELAAAKPDIIMFSSSGYGDSGPDRSYVSWGPNIEALSGLAVLSGFPERECSMTQYAYPDALSALHGLFAVMCALDHRGRTGHGQYVNLSQLEATVGALGPLMMEPLALGREPGRLGNRSARAAPHGCYRCRGEDRWCAIAVFDDSEWERFCRVLGREEWLAEPRFAQLSARIENAEELDRLVEQWTQTRAEYDVMAAMQEAGIAAGVVQTTEDQLHRDPQLEARQFFEEIDHLKKGKVVATGIPLGLSDTPGRTTHAGSAVGHDNDYVLAEILGLSPEEIERYVALGAIET